MTDASPHTQHSSHTRRIAIAALLIASGNIASRVIGLVREGILTSTFGASSAVDAFTASSSLTTVLYDLLVSGAISAALVPVFSDYAEHDEAGLWNVASTIINLVLLAIAALVVLMIWQAPLVVTVLAGGFEPEIRAQAILMLRLLLPSVLFLGLSGLVTALLQARQRFLLPAFTTSAYNAGIIVAVLLLTAWLGPLSMVIGVLSGALLQVLLQLPGLRGMRYRPVIDLGHPGVRRILALYAPVAIGIGFSLAGIVLDRNLASRVGDNTLSFMRYATTLVQLPLGLVASAVSFAVLPTLARLSASSDDESFRRTLAMGMKVVLLLILPATALLAALAEPVVRLLFQRGAFSPADTIVTARALRLYLPGLPAAALDQLLLFAFYARRRTLAPNLVQGAAIGCYALTALGLLGLTSLRMEALVLGNSVQWIAHLAIMAWLARRLIDLRGLRLGEAALKCTAASILVGGAAWWAAGLVGGPGNALIQVGVAAAVGAALYLGACQALGVEALGFFTQMVVRRLRRAV
jgi:putative peptidoglycan lipid II flippase